MYQLKFIRSKTGRWTIQHIIPSSTLHLEVELLFFTHYDSYKWCISRCIQRHFTFLQGCVA